MALEIKNDTNCKPYLTLTVTQTLAVTLIRILTLTVTLPKIKHYFFKINITRIVTSNSCESPMHHISPKCQNVRSQQNPHRIIIT